MLNTIYCITHQHNLWLVLLAAAVCVIATATALRLILIGERSSGRTQILWLLFSGACGGGGAWATHFIAMLAFNPGFATGYEGVGTAASLVISIVGATAGAFAAVQTKRPWNILLWGVLFSASVGVMHYSGMAALRVPGVMHFDLAYVAASVAVGAIFSMAALWVAQGARTTANFISAVLCLTSAICCLHFIGMGGMSIVADAAIAVPASILPNSVMAMGVGALTALILLSALCTIWIETRTKSASLSLLNSVIAAMPQGLAYFDAEDRYVLGNDTYRREFAASGFEAKEGLTYRELLKRSEGFNVPAAEGREEAWVEELMNTRAGGVRDQAMADGRYLRIENNRTKDGGLITVVSDITGLKQQADDLAVARDLAEAATRAKSEFLTNMSHELRTPLNGIVAVADLLAGDALTPKQAELVEMIRGSGSILNRLVCDILDFASVEMGAADLKAAPFDLHGVVTAVVSSFAFEAKEKGLSLTLEAGPELNGLLLGDEDRVKQILANLVSNAVKFTDKGKVSVTVAYGEGQASLTVADTGVGFDSETKARLFSGFEQADGSATRQYGGAGLGLAIANKFSASMGGSLSCESTPGAGSTFVLKLPIQIAYTPTSGAIPTAPSETDQGAPRVLVVDDNATNRRVLGLILDGAEMQTTFAENGQEAVDQWRANHFDAIFMDIQMPVMDGLTATRTIRALETREGRNATPIIVVSANALPEHVEASYGAGADGHVAKPVTAASLFSALEQLDAA